MELPAPTSTSAFLVAELQFQRWWLSRLVPVFTSQAAVAGLTWPCCAPCCSLEPLPWGTPSFTIVSPPAPPPPGGQGESGEQERPASEVWRKGRSLSSKAIQPLMKPIVNLHSRLAAACFYK
jgi:hypothetical protein